MRERYAIVEAYMRARVAWVGSVTSRASATGSDYSTVTSYAISVLGAAHGDLQLQQKTSPWRDRASRNVSVQLVRECCERKRRTENDEG